MWKYLQGLFSKEAQPRDWTPDELQRDKDPAAVAEVMTVQGGFVGKAQASDVDQARQIHVEFAEKVCVRPGIRLLDQLHTLGADQVVAWFRPETSEPEPKALAQLFVDLARRGQTLGEQPGFDVFLHGRWSAGGGCSDPSHEALQWLAKAIGRPIHIYFQESPRDEGFRITKIELESTNE